MKEEVSKALLVTSAVAAVIMELGEIPSGHLYARLMDKMSLEVYNKVIGLLKGAKLVQEKGHLLTWIGPKLK